MLILGIFPFFGGNFSKGQVALTKQMNFRQRSKGGRGVVFNPKIYVTDFGPLNRAFRGKI